MHRATDNTANAGFAHQRQAASRREIAAIMLVNAVATLSIFMAGFASIG